MGAVAKHYHDKNRDQASVEKWVQITDPDRTRIDEIAAPRFIIDTPTDFVCNQLQQEPVFRRKHQELLATTLKHAAKSREKEHCILLPIECISTSDRTRSQQSAAGFANKDGAKEGRFTMHLS
jgi:hypothetical protein